jgi:hypothetical protein
VSSIESANPTESQRTEITQFFFGQALRSDRHAG